MPMQRIPLLAVRLQWLHSTFSSGALFWGWAESDAVAAVDASESMALPLMQRS